jgi:AbrB family looped-hinge helix DNA binding protein
MSEATLTSKGQVTIPKAVREKLGLQTGDRIDFVDTDKGIILVPVTRDLRALRGILKGRVASPVTVEEMNRAIGDMAVRRSQRARHR